MSFKALDKMIRSAALDLLKEQQEQPKEKSAYEKATEKYDEKKAKEKEAKEKKAKEGPKSKQKVGVPGYGSGRFKRFLEDLGKSDNPSLLMKELGVSSASGATDLDKVASVLRQAIRNNPIMADAYKAPVLTTSGEKKILKVPVTNDGRQELNIRNRHKFVYLTLEAAEKTGLLNLKDGVDFLSFSQTDIPAIFQKN